MPPAFLFDELHAIRYKGIICNRFFEKRGNVMTRKWAEEKLPEDLTNPERRREIIEGLKQKGVTFVDPASAFIESTVEIGVGTVIWPRVYIFGSGKIGAWSKIGPEVVIRNSVIGEDTVIDPLSFITESEIGDKCEIGSSAHIHESRIENRCEIGKAEIVRSLISEETVAKHMCYIGDAEVGKRCNIGADAKITSEELEAGGHVVICNFDGSQKHKTVIEDDVFIGSGTKIIAPRCIGCLAYIAANSVITRDVPRGNGKGILVVTRSRRQEHHIERVVKQDGKWFLLK